jgi:hypothetical protein
VFGPLTGRSARGSRWSPLAHSETFLRSVSRRSPFASRGLPAHGSLRSPFAHAVASPVGHPPGAASHRASPDCRPVLCGPLPSWTGRTEIINASGRQYNPAKQLIGDIVADYRARYREHTHRSLRSRFVCPETTLSIYRSRSAPLSRSAALAPQTWIQRAARNGTNVPLRAARTTLNPDSTNCERAKRASNSRLVSCMGSCDREEYDFPLDST